MKEAAIKAKLIDFLIERHHSKNISIAHEVRFEDSRRRADLICIEDHLHAFEIKSSYDSITKLKEQVEDYLKCFESLTIVVPKKHLANTKKICPISVGIILIENNSLKNYRPAKIRKKLVKISLLKMIKGSEINRQLRQLGIKHNKENGVTENRIILANKITLKTAIKLTKTHLFESSILQFNTFLSERGSVTTIDDLILLNQAPRKIFS